MLKNSNFAAQAFAFVLALAVSAGAFGVTVAPDHVNAGRTISSEIVA